ncbi:retrovirus-related pol polyprotein from transposon TNT 1-94 [Tanacetum coccineum]
MLYTNPKISHDDGSKPSSDDGKKVDKDPRKESECNDQEKEDNINSTNNVNTQDWLLNGHTQEERIDYDEVFAPVARIEAIRLFLAYASFKDFMVYQMDVKIAFLYGNIEEEVYVCQPPGFEDPDIPDRVYKVEKSLYGLHQAPRAWYETLSTYLLDNGFQTGKIYKTLFIKRYKRKQKKDGIFISQDKYVDEILKKFRFTKVKTASTPMETQKPLLKDEDGEEVDVHMYRSMIGSLMYLTSSRPDIMFVVCAYARYQVNPKVSHLHAVKRIFRYLKGQPKLGLWYPKDSPFDLVAYTNSDYARASLDMKFTIGVVANSTTEAEYVAASSCCGQFWSTVKAKTINGEEQLHALVDGNKIIVIESSVRRDLQLEDAEGVDCLPNSTIFEQLTLMGLKTTAWNEFSSTMASAIIYEAVHKELGDSLVRDATTASSLEAEQYSGNITKNRSKATPNESSSLGTTSGGGPRGNTLRSDVDSLKLNELMELCTNLQTRVLDLEKTKSTQHNEIDSLKRRAKKLEKKYRLRTYKLKRLYKVGLTARVESSGDEEDLGEDASKQGRRINTIDADEDITLINVQDDADNEMFDVNALNGEENYSTAATTVTITTEEITLAQALEALKTSKPKEKIDADHQLAERLQAQEQEELSDAEKATLFQQLLEKRRKHFAAKRVEEKRNKPPTKAQQRQIMCTYLKNMEGYKLKDLKSKGFDAIQEMFDKAFRRQKVDDDKETTELKQCMEIIPDEEEMYIIFSQMLKTFDREDLEELYKLVKARYGSTRPVESMDYLLWNGMKIMFEPHVEDEIYMLVEKKYPLTPSTLSMMLEKKLQIDYESKMAYQLCKLIIKQLKK